MRRAGRINHRHSFLTLRRAAAYTFFERFIRRRMRLYSPRAIRHTRYCSLNASRDLW